MNVEFHMDIQDASTFEEAALIFAREYIDPKKLDLVSLIVDNEEGNGFTINVLYNSDGEWVITV